MSADTQPVPSPKVREYLQSWGTGIAQVMQEVAGAPHTFQELSPEATQALLASLKENTVSIQFEADQHLTGNQGFSLSTKDGVRLSQLLLSEPEDGSSTLSDEHRDAIGELFRQFAGAAATSVKALAGGEVGFKWLGLIPFPGTPSLRIGVQWTSPGLSALSLVAEIGSNLLASLTPAAAEPLELPPPSPPPTALATTRDPKLGH